MLDCFYDYFYYYGKNNDFEFFFFFFQAEDGIRDLTVTGVQTCALPICRWPAVRRHSPRGERGKGERDQRVVAGERKAEKAPRCLVATHDARRLQPFHQILRRAEVGDRPRAFLRSCPPVPFDAGVVDCERGAGQHDERYQTKTADDQRRRLAQGCNRDQRGERNRAVIRDALLEAERARRDTQTILKEPGADDGGGADRRDRSRGGGRRIFSRA